MFYLLCILIILCHMLRVCEFEEKWSIVKYIMKYGYPAEAHIIETEDGYILKTHRIPHGKNSNKTNQNVILLVHGMSGSAENFIALGPDDALAFLLADRGFDVWLFNARGTLHCRKHKIKSPSYFQGAGFWNFSWHEIGVFDLPANIDYILQNTNKPNLLYIGHSQGGTSFFVMNSEKPEYTRKIRAAVLLAPAIFMYYTEHSLLKILSRFYEILERLVTMFSYHELIIPNSPTLNRILKSFCSSSNDFMQACRDILSIAGGHESDLVNVSLVATIINYSPTGFSTRQGLHFIQVLRSSYFRQYDYGKTNNLAKYNSTTPTHYNLTNCRVPLALFRANGDNVVSFKATNELSKLLPNVAMIYDVPYDNFNHFDYVLAYNARELVYEPLYDFLMQFVKK